MKFSQYYGTIIYYIYNIIHIYNMKLQYNIYLYIKAQKIIKDISTYIQTIAICITI